jgi:hypothetical protein
MEPWSLPKARPVSCNDSPAFQRRHMSVPLLCRKPVPLSLSNKHHLYKNDSYQMVFQRPVETAICDYTGGCSLSGVECPEGIHAFAPIRIGKNIK